MSVIKREDMTDEDKTEMVKLFRSKNANIFTQDKASAGGGMYICMFLFSSRGRDGMLMHYVGQKHGWSV